MTKIDVETARIVPYPDRFGEIFRDYLTDLNHLKCHIDEFWEVRSVS